MEEKKKKENKNTAETRIRTWVIAATTQCTNHYTISAVDATHHALDLDGETLIF